MRFSGKYFVFPVVFLVLLVLGLGQNALAKPPLWKLQDEDTTIYLFGTFHILDKDTVWYTHEIDDALKGSDALYIEITLSELDGSGSYAYVLSRGFFPAGTYLTDYISEREFYKLQELISMAGGNPLLVFRMKPMLAAAVLEGASIPDEEFKRAYGAEETLIRRAQKFHIPLKGMEGLEVHLGAMFDYPAETQIKYLREAMKAAEKKYEDIDYYVHAWQRGDLKAMDINEEEVLKKFPEVQEKLLFERNRNWVAKIKGMMDKPGQIFIAVGAGHFAGSGNVVELLEKEGFKPERQ